MQKKLIAAAVATLMSSAAMAQVTVYGVADVFFSRVTATGQATETNIDSGGLSGSRLGVKGSEDLGNGLSAIFTLEYALAVTTNSGVGVADAPYSGSVSRQAFVGLTGGMGTVVAGRLQTAAYDWSCAYNPVAGSAMDLVGRLGAATTLACGTGGRRDNAIAYQSPVMAGGLKLAVNHARLTEDANGQPTDKDGTANMLHATWNSGPLAVGAVYTGISNKQTAAEDDVTEIGIGGSYDLGVAKLFAGYQQQETENALGAGRDDSLKKYWVAVSVPVGTGSVHGMYAANNLEDGVADSDTKGFNVTYTHPLSKRTTAYAAYSKLNNDRNASRGFAVQAPAADGSASFLGLGVRHTF